MSKPSAKKKEETQETTTTAPQTGDIYTRISKDKLWGNAIKQDIEDVFYETGVYDLDLAFSNGKGLIGGGFYNVWSGAGVGKTTILGSMCTGLIERWEERGVDGRILYVDTESTQTLLKSLNLCKTIVSSDGKEVHRFGDRLMYMDSIQTLEQLEPYVMDILTNPNSVMSDVKLIILDSLNGATSKFKLENELGKADMGRSAGIKHEFATRIKPYLKATGVSFMQIIHERSNINRVNMYQPDNKIGASKAYLHHADYTYYLKKVSMASDEKKANEVSIKTSDGEIAMSRKYQVQIISDNDSYSCKHRYRHIPPLTMVVYKGKGVSNLARMSKLLVMHGLIYKETPLARNFQLSEQLPNVEKTSLDKAALQEYLRKNLRELEFYLRKNKLFYHIDTSEYENSTMGV